MISTDKIIESMERTGMVPVFNHIDSNVAKQVLDASYKAGVRVFEFTNRGANALEVFGSLTKHAERYDDLILGIGTIFNKTDAQAFLDAGAKFIVSPALIPEVATYCNQKKAFWIPGCATVTEIHQALQLGAKVIKAFPGNVLGPGFVKSVKAVYPKTPIMPTGGVAPTEENLSAWFDAGVLCVGMGSKLFKKDLLANADYIAVQAKIAYTLEIIKKIRKN